MRKWGEGLIGYWGSFEFQVSSDKVYTFDSYGRKLSLDIEEQELTGKKPSTYIKGEGLEEISITVDLKADLGVDVESELDKLRTALYSRSPQTFAIGDKPLSQNKWLLTNVDESETKLDNQGNYLSAKVSLTFQEYARGGSYAASKAAKKKKGAVEGGVIDKLNIGDTRYNPNAEQSISNGIAGKTSTVFAFNSQPSNFYNFSGVLR